MAILHTVNKSPFERTSLSRCLSMAQANSAILLIEDGVYGATGGGSFSADVDAAMKNVKVYALEPDLAARGIKDKVMEGIELVDYAGFVDLVAEYDTVQSWL